MCLFRRFHLQGSRGPETRGLLVVNERFSDKRKAVNGTLWTDSNFLDLVSGTYTIKIDVAQGIITGEPQ